MIRDYKIKRLEQEGYSLEWLGKNVRAIKGNESYHGKLSKVFKDIFGYA